MKRLLLLLSLFISSISIAQLWVQPGATWFYEYDLSSTICWNGPAFKYEYESDTQIGGQLCQKFTHTAYTTSNSILDSNTTTIGYTYTSGDTVFYWHNNQFFVLFDFGAQIGDSWVISDSVDTNFMTNTICGDTSSVTVTDIGTTQIDGNTYRTITLEKDTLSPYLLDGTYIERFGKINNTSYYTQHLFIFPELDLENCEQNVIIDWCSIIFDCYYDDSFNLNPSGGCGSVGINEREENELSIYPNPAISNLIINLNANSKIDYLIITNILGEEIHKRKVTSSNINIDISNLTKGIYFITTYKNHKLNLVNKFIKG